MFRFDTLPDVRLAAGDLIAWRQPRGVRLRVLTGRLWVTRAGDLDDHFLHPSDVLALPPGMAAWIGGESSACLRFEVCDRAGRAIRGRGLSRRAAWWSALRWIGPTWRLR